MEIYIRFQERKPKIKVPKTFTAVFELLMQILNALRFSYAKIIQ